MSKLNPRAAARAQEKHEASRIVSSLLSVADREAAEQAIFGPEGRPSGVGWVVRCPSCRAVFGTYDILPENKSGMTSPKCQSCQKNIPLGHKARTFHPSVCRTVDAEVQEWLREDATKRKQSQKASAS